MPAEVVKSSWADEVELESGTPPAPVEEIKDGQKILTSYKYDDNNKLLKVVRTYKITKQMVSKSIAQRKTWKKFGDSTNDKPGPNPQTTFVSEDIYMQFVSNKEEEKTEQQDPIKAMAKCRICSGDHWSVNCPFKGTAIEKMNEPPKPNTPATETGNKPGKYVPPFMKDSQSKLGLGARNKDDTSAIRISNLSESTVESDLEELVKKIGPYNKIYLARDKNTGACKGFAYVHFKNRKDAATAIELLNGHGYDHLILNVEWSKPQNQN